MNDVWKQFVSEERKVEVQLKNKGFIWVWYLSADIGYTVCYHGKFVLCQILLIDVVLNGMKNVVVSNHIVAVLPDMNFSITLSWKIVETFDERWTKMAKICIDIFALKLFSLLLILWFMI